MVVTYSLHNKEKLEPNTIYFKKTFDYKEVKALDLSVPENKRNPRMDKSRHPELRVVECTGLH